ncbi:MAG: hypothetical protein V1906_03840 [Candidatus Woesearchaeota archaeon]
MESLIKIILLVVFLVIAVILIVTFFTAASTNKVKAYGCWISNGIMASNAAFRTMMSVPCKQEIIEEPLSKEDFAVYLTDVWFMYGKGNWDFHIKKDDSILVSAFKLKEDIIMRDLYVHLITHVGKRNLADGGTLDVNDMAKSDYNYLQSGSQGQTLCLHKGMKPSDGVSMINRNKVYYVLFWDDTPRGGSTGDKIILSPKPYPDMEDIVCCTLQEGSCLTLSGIAWYDPMRVIGPVFNAMGSAASIVGSMVK